MIARSRRGVRSLTMTSEKGRSSMVRRNAPVWNSRRQSLTRMLGIKGLRRMPHGS